METMVVIDDIVCGVDHIHEKKLDQACLEIYTPNNTTKGTFLELLSQRAECLGCDLQSVISNVINGSRVSVDTRYGGVTRLRIVEHHRNSRLVLCSY